MVKRLGYSLRVPTTRIGQPSDTNNWRDGASQSSRFNGRFFHNNIIFFQKFRKQGAHGTTRRTTEQHVGL